MVKPMKKKYNYRMNNNQTNLQMQNKKTEKKTKLSMVLSSSLRIMNLQMKSIVCVGVFQSDASAWIHSYCQWRTTQALFYLLVYSLLDLFSPLVVWCHLCFHNRCQPMFIYMNIDSYTTTGLSNPSLISSLSRKTSAAPPTTRLCFTKSGTVRMKCALKNLRSQNQT